MKPSFNLFDERKYALLPGYSKPLPDELLSSWLTRLATDHTVPLSTFVKLVWPEFVLYANDVDLVFEDRFLRQLAVQTNCTLEQVKQTTLASINKYIGGMNSLFVMPSVKLGSNPRRIYQRMMYCGNCLSKGEPYFRKIWRLSLFVACPDCGCYLNDCCPWCGAYISFSRNALRFTEFESMVQCHSCGKDLRLTKCRPAPDEIIRLQKIINELLDVKKEKKYPESFLFVLYRIMSIMRNPRAKYIELQKDIYSVLDIPFKARTGKVCRFDLLNLEERINAMRAADWLLRDWPIRYMSYSKKHHVSLKYKSRWPKDPPRWITKVANLNCNEFVDLYT